MQKCRITMTTATDGEKNTFFMDGELQVSPTETFVRYNEENARVVVQVQEEFVRIERTGDYSMVLPLQKGKRQTGALGIGNQTGEIQIDAHEIAYTKKQDGLLLNLRYDLYIGNEKQEMELTLLAKVMETLH